MHLFRNKPFCRWLLTAGILLLCFSIGCLMGVDRSNPEDSASGFDTANPSDSQIIGPLIQGTVRYDGRLYYWNSTRMIPPDEGWDPVGQIQSSVNVGETPTENCQTNRETLVGLTIWANAAQSDLIYIEQDGSYIRFFTQLYSCNWMCCDGGLYLAEADYLRVIGEPSTCQKRNDTLPRDAELLGVCTVNTLVFPEAHLQTNQAGVAGRRIYRCEDGCTLYMEIISNEQVTYTRFLNVELRDLVNSPCFDVLIRSAI